VFLEDKMVKTTRKNKREKETKTFYFAEFLRIKDHFFKDFSKK
jgi:hypothetical protein